MQNCNKLDLDVQTNRGWTFGEIGAVEYDQPSPVTEWELSALQETHNFSSNAIDSNAIDPNVLEELMQKERCGKEDFLADDDEVTPGIDFYNITAEGNKKQNTAQTDVSGFAFKTVIPGSPVVTFPSDLRTFASDIPKCVCNSLVWVNFYNICNVRGNKRPRIRSLAASATRVGVPEFFVNDRLLYPLPVVHVTEYLHKLEPSKCQIKLYGIQPAPPQEFPKALREDVSLDVWVPYDMEERAFIFERVKLKQLVEERRNHTVFCFKFIILDDDEKHLCEVDSETFAIKAYI